MFSRSSLGGLVAATTLLSQGCVAQLFPGLGGGDDDGGGGLFGGGGLLGGLGGGADLETVRNFGDNPSGLEMAVYRPSNVAPNPAVIFALHPCFGSGDMYNGMTEYPARADEHGFMVVYPSSPGDTGCWDVASDESLTRDGGGDSTGLANMVEFVISEYGADPAQIFVTGSSSGCMMTNVMTALYPELFAAATCYSGVPAGCLAGSPGSSPISADPECAGGENIKTGEEWAEIVNNMNPGYDGPRPKFATLHGTTDSIVAYENLEEQIKQWSTVFGLESTAENPNTPEQGYTQIVFGDGTQFVAYSAEGVGHTVPVHEDLDLEWFGITGGA